MFFVFITTLLTDITHELISKPVTPFHAPTNINTDSFIGVEREPQRLWIGLVLLELPVIAAPEDVRHHSQTTQVLLAPHILTQ